MRKKTYLNMRKAVYEEPTANIPLNGENWKHPLWEQDLAGHST